MTTTPADALVLFGVTGDLAKKMLLPALYQLSARGLLTQPVVGVGRSDWGADRLRQHAHDCVAAEGAVDEAAFSGFAKLLDYVRVDYDDPATFTALAARVRPLGRLSHYVAVPPASYAVIARRLAEAGLADDALLVLEKPFGSDLASARALQRELLRCFPEDRLRRVDHFLGKDVVEDLLTIRFANPLLGNALDRRLVRSVQVTMAEDFDVADRAGFYDATGCLRDVVENHLLQTLAYFLMEAPRTDSADDILAERTRALRAVRAVRPDDYVRGQYAGYLDVPGIRPGSVTETFAALRLYVDTDRWSGVPFTVRAGKAMATTALELIVELEQAVPGYCHTDCARQAEPNLLRFRLSPRAGLTFSLLAQDGARADRVDPVEAVCDFTRLTGSGVRAYENVLHDVITGDPRRFVRMDMVEECWRIVGDILAPAGRPAAYQPGGWGPDEARRLVTDERWLPLEQG